jgi:hypothetical protein
MNKKQRKKQGLAPPIIFFRRRCPSGRLDMKTNISVGMISIPIITVAVNGDGRDAIIPTLGRIIGKPYFFQVVDVVIEPETSTPEIRVLENANAGVTKDTDRADFVVESVRHRRPPLTQFQTKIVSPVFSILVKASANLRRMGPAPLMLGQ